MDVQERFDELQRKLPDLWRSMSAMTHDEQTIVVVPSMSIASVKEWGEEIQPYEERYLFLLLLLRQPRARLIYVTSQLIPPSIIDYYLDLLPGVIPSHARPRLHLLSPMDGSYRPLTEKLLERPRLLARIRSLIPDPARAHLVPYNTTELERDLALELGIPMYGPDPRFSYFGTKSGCRKIFAEEGVPYPLGFEDLRSIPELVNAIVKMRSERPTMTQALVKLNEGLSGSGNALVDLEGLPSPGDPEEPAQIEDRLSQMKLELEGGVLDHYLADLSERGGVVEERIVGDELRSPSVQLRVTPLGELEILSTHDQVLGGPSGQTYLGCRFPADTSYGPAITAEAEKIGRRLAREGVLGRFALDFVVVRSGNQWTIYAIEINLRKGGTTHPFLTLQFLTDGTYDASAAVFTAPGGREKFFVASDHVENPSYRGLTPDDLFDIVVRRGLHFDASRQTGVVFHMMSALPQQGTTGLTAVGNSHEEADEIYDRAVAVLDEEAKDSLSPLGERSRAFD